jgi:hypothetical protein
VWQAMENVASSNQWGAEFAKNRDEKFEPHGPLDFLSVAPMLEDPGDIEYQYDIICDAEGRDDKTPKVVCHKV